MQDVKMLQLKFTKMTKTAYSSVKLPKQCKRKRIIVGFRNESSGQKTVGKQTTLTEVALCYS